jgi:hypothetical protein
MEKLEGKNSLFAGWSEGAQAWLLTTQPDRALRCPLLLRAARQNLASGQNALNFARSCHLLQPAARLRTVSVRWSIAGVLDDKDQNIGSEHTHRIRTLSFAVLI